MLWDVQEIKITYVLNTSPEKKQYTWIFTKIIKVDLEKVTDIAGVQK